MEGKRILRVETRRKDLRFPFPAKFSQRLEGARVKHLGRRAKYLVAELSTGEALIMHLGMTGRFTVSTHGRGRKPGEFYRDSVDDEKHDHVVFDMQSGPRIVFNDARRFGFMDLWPADDVDSYPGFRGMGPEPISSAFTGAYLEEAFEGKKTPVKAALLDQRAVAGLGNIYVSEALFRSGIDPRTLAGAIRRDRLERLALNVRDVIDEAIDAGGSTISDFGKPSGELGNFQHRFRVYDKAGKPCPNCARPIRRLVQSGRSTFYCARCQR
jgi:formamidopyrimidine-DNA glycosylase